jgi:hypothetical protein
VKCDDTGRARAALERVPPVARVDAHAAGDGFTTFRLHLSEEREIGETLADLVRREGWPLRELRRDDRTLEQVFRELSETAAEVPA